AIVDITTTGATLAANGLKTLEDGTILASQAQLAASLAADWSVEARAACVTLLSRLAARERAKASLVLRARLDGKPDALLAKLTKKTGATVLSRPATGNTGGEFSLLCPRTELMTAMTLLRANDCDGAVTAQDADYVFVKDDPLVAAFEKAVGK
ncbi:MAG: ATP phosphoribosyltransferase, partial [Rhizomicrobium sp.]